MYFLCFEGISIVVYAFLFLQKSVNNVIHTDVIYLVQLTCRCLYKEDI